jgi:VWFA-related protein
MCAKAAVVLLLVCASQASAQTQPFSTKVEAVRVDVLVTENNGRVVRGLQAADFDVRDNGVQQQVDLVSFEQIPLNLVLVFDMSSSVAGERLVHLREGIRGLLAGLKPEDQAALITFDRAVYRHSGLTTELERVRTALVTADGKGDTALIDAVYTGMMIGESDVGRSLVMVFSDGLDTASILSSEMVLDTAKRSDVGVFGAPRNRLFAICATPPAGRSMTPDQRAISAQRSFPFSTNFASAI